MKSSFIEDDLLIEVSMLSEECFVYEELDVIYACAFLAFLTAPSFVGTIGTIDTPVAKI